MSRYTTEPHDTLPSIAEACGHSGEWLEIWELNKVNMSDPNMVFPGTDLILPNEWTHYLAEGGDSPDAVVEALEEVTSSRSKRGTSSSTD